MGLIPWKLRSFSNSALIGWAIVSILGRRPMPFMEYRRRIAAPSLAYSITPLQGSDSRIEAIDSSTCRRPNLTPPPPNHQAIIPRFRAFFSVINPFRNYKQPPKVRCALMESCLLSYQMLM
ncbi:hypothetical protein Zmor_009871 [Zophobas morio]|uniref:Uncharacterized protein n=1 Tax=Zophobas morio TaxID=2755281 RepID=A0AA38IM49_9CUCU|nr:hypothetical protein Zmor_009863 [Zophobas morio]KAJ3658113.1 hypothetical protein Zmor_009871 [Zophobas morio]